MDHSTSTTGENGAPSFSGRWLQFNDWLAQQRDGSSDASEPTSDDDAPSTSGQDVDYQAHTTPNTTTTPISHRSTTPQQPPPSTSTSTSPPSPAPASRRPTTLPLILRDCRTETRLVHNYARARQEMTVMLAIPGMPLDKAPVLTARQASSLLASLSEPLAQVEVGRLTRRLENPSKLVPTEERGTLSLWLLPNDEMSFMWHTHQSSSSMGEGLDSNKDNNSNNGNGGIREGLDGRNNGNGVASSSSVSSTSTSTSSTPHPLPFTAPPLPDSVTIATSSLTMWEELAHFPAGYNFMQDDQPLVTIHMLTGDRSGRAFYIKFREDVQAVTNQKERGPGRMYFWLTEPSKSRGIRSLGALKGCWKRPTSLAKRSGVGEKQIESISNLSSGMAAFMIGLRTPFVHRSAAAACGGIDITGGGTNSAAAASAAATATAIYHDRARNVSCPCSISVVVALTLATADGDILPGLAAQQARQRAEAAAKAAVSRVGKMRVEEFIADEGVSKLRLERNKVRLERNKNKKKLEEGAAALISQAVAAANGRERRELAYSAPERAETSVSPPPCQSKVVTVDNLEEVLNSGGKESKKKDQEFFNSL